MENRQLALHETLESHELLSFQNLCCTKSSMMQLLASDEGLKSILQQDVEITKRQIKELQSILSRANLQ
ncbi:hypothetical protein [Aneurinibacillus tyrosinisolvens]|uniref:hypothetical protein n=1 Tax=Aneurinibacillus tyrosinisolvens TaxID=1443435 RepID=UPI00063EFF7E|nr:hypothetical protein [Aneurinibacillus tyrosinisolvens]